MLTLPALTSHLNSILADRRLLLSSGHSLPFTYLNSARFEPVAVNSISGYPRLCNLFAKKHFKYLIKINSILFKNQLFSNSNLFMRI